jgi:hypothetical protein
MKAAESRKAPRRIIDLRECISLEIGLEYRNYEHILTLGTFKRTFFFAAPSDALMLQWANVLEKTKNAQDGKYNQDMICLWIKRMYVMYSSSVWE